MHSHDKKGKGYINYTDFLVAILDRRRLSDEDALWAAFKYFDHDNDDKLSQEDITKTMGRIGAEMTPEEVKSFMFAFNEGDLVSFESFKALVDNNSPLSSQCTPMQDCKRIMRRNSKARIQY